MGHRVSCNYSIYLAGEDKVHLVREFTAELPDNCRCGRRFARAGSSQNSYCRNKEGSDFHLVTRVD